MWLGDALSHDDALGHGGELICYYRYCGDALIKDAFKTKRFDLVKLGMYQIRPKIPPKLNIRYIEKLVSMT